MSTEYKTMIVFPGGEIRQEGVATESFFGAGVENPVSAIGKELHIHTSGNQTLLTLDNPIMGGPIVACSNGRQEILIPGEEKVFDRKNLIIFVKKEKFIQIIFLDSDLLRT